MSSHSSINVPAIAVEIGDFLKYDTTVNEVNRAAATVFQCPSESFPISSITSSRAQVIYNRVLSAAKYHTDSNADIPVQFDELQT